MTLAATVAILGVYAVAVSLAAHASGRARSLSVQDASAVPLAANTGLRAPSAQACTRSTKARASAVSGVLDELIQEQAARPLEPASPFPARAAEPRLSMGVLQTLVRRCAPTTPESVVMSIIAGESGGRPFVVSQNRPTRSRFAASSRSEAEAELTRMEAHGANFDIGLMQLNSETLHHMHVQVAQALDPCRNIFLGASIFDAAYAASYARHGSTMMLLSAYSAYNTGDPERGVRSGYADQAAARLRAPAKPLTAG